MYLSNFMCPSKVHLSVLIIYTRKLFLQEQKLFREFYTIWGKVILVAVKGLDVTLNSSFKEGG